MKKYIIVLTLLLVLTACNDKSKDEGNNLIEDNSQNDITNKENETIQVEVFEQLENEDFSYINGYWENYKGDIYYFEVVEDKELYHYQEFIRDFDGELIKSEYDYNGDLKFSKINGDFAMFHSFFPQWTLQFNILRNGVEIEDYDLSKFGDKDIIYVSGTSVPVNMEKSFEGFLKENLYFRVDE